MPRVLKTLDQIAREKQRGALFITFHIEEVLYPDNPEFVDLRLFDYKQCYRRILFIQWLNENHINFEECHGFGSLRSIRYKGQIYLDVPYDETNPQYQLLCQYLENPDSSLNDPAVAWYYLSLEIAMEYKHHDDPKYWEW